MTDVELQKDIVVSLNKFLKSNEIMMPLEDKFRDLKVYRQDLPLKQDENDEELRNYIVVMIGEEQSSEDEWDVEIHFSVCIEDRDKDRSGNINVLYLMNEIYMYFIKKGTIGRHCRMEKKAHKILNLESVFPYFEGDLVTTWKLPLPNEEGLEELV